jgi:hypothetical protein
MIQDRDPGDERPEPEPERQTLAVTWRAPADALHFEDAPAGLLVLPSPKVGRKPLLLPFGDRGPMTELVRAVLAWASGNGILKAIAEEQAGRVAKVAPIVGLDGKEMRR